MKQMNRALTCVGALGALLALGPAEAASNKVVIGDIDDMSGPYADILGAGGIEAIKMAIADFGPRSSASRSKSSPPIIRTSRTSPCRNSANGPIRTV